MIYLDPPYYKKGRDLYLNYYNENDHISIAEYLRRQENLFWVISYDDAEEIRKLYRGYRKETYKLSYSANKYYKGSEIVIFSDKLKIPEFINPTDKKAIRKIIGVS